MPNTWFTDRSCTRRCISQNRRRRRMRRAWLNVCVYVFLFLVASLSIYHLSIPIRLTKPLGLSPLAAPSLPTLPPQTPHPLPLLLVAKLSRHSPRYASYQTQRYAKIHRRESLRGALSARRGAVDSAYVGLDT
jgi:hypothetical protein